MNRVIILMFATLLALNANAQNLPVNEKTGRIEFSGIVITETKLTKTELYNNAREWVSIVFNSSNHVLQLDDKEEGKLIGKGNFAITMTLHQTHSFVKFTIIIYAKDGRYKYVINDFVHKSTKSGFSGGALELAKPRCGGLSMTKKGWRQIKEQTATRIPELIEDLRIAMDKKGESNSDEW